MPYRDPRLAELARREALRQRAELEARDDHRVRVDSDPELSGVAFDGDDRTAEVPVESGRSPNLALVLVLGVLGSLCAFGIALELERESEPAGGSLGDAGRSLRLEGAVVAATNGVDVAIGERCTIELVATDEDAGADPSCRVDARCPRVHQPLLDGAPCTDGRPAQLLGLQMNGLTFDRPRRLATFVVLDHAGGLQGGVTLKLDPMGW